MKLLPEEFIKKKFNHKLVKRENDIAIYERWKDNQPKHYEVVKIKSHNGYKLGGSYIEPAEVYPSDSMWGNAGWTYTDIDDAMTKFTNLLSNENNNTDKS